MKTKLKSPMRATCHSFGGVVCAGAVWLIATCAHAQNLFVADWTSGNVYEFTPNGARSTFATGLSYPDGMAFDSAGNLFVACQGGGIGGGGSIIKITPSGAQSNFASGLTTPNQVAFDNAGDLFVGTGGSPGNLYEYTPGGGQSIFATGLNAASGLAFDSAGNLFEADQHTGHIYEFTPGAVRTTFDSGLSEPADLAFDSAGNLFVGDWSSSSIFKITPGAAQSTFATGVRYPWGLAFDNAGNLFEADYGSGNIYKFTPGAVRTTFASGLTPSALVFQTGTNNCTNGCLSIYNPNDMVVTTCSNSLPVSYQVGVSDSCCSNYTLVVVPSSGTSFPLGTTIVTSSVTDSCGNSNFCTFTVTVLQITNPPVIISYPSNVVICISSNGCGYMPDDTAQVQATNSAGGGAVVTQNIPPGTPVCSNTNVTFTATDACGDATSVTVPCSLINCSSNCLQIDCSTNKTVSCATNWSFDPPVVDSTCCGTNYSITIFGSDVVSNTGACSMSSTRTWLITDCNGQTNFCSQTVTISPPSSYTMTFRPGVYYLIAYQFTAAAANVVFPNNGDLDTDELIFYGCTNQTIYFFDSTSPSGFDDASFNPVPAAPILSPGEGMFFLNSGPTETITFTGTPVCPPSPSPLCPCGTLSLVSYELDCPGTYEDITGLQPQQGVEILRWNGNGYNTNTFTGGAWTLGPPVLNVGEAAFILVPCATNCVQIQCWTNVVVTSCTNVPVYYNPTVTDTCCTNWNVVCSPPSGSYFAPGTTNTVTCSAVDFCGMSNSCTFTVTVLPGINCSGCFQITSGVSAQNLFVANTANNTIEEFNSAGAGTVFASSGMFDPVFLAFDNAGNLYVANFSYIEEFNSAGAGTVFASSGLSSPTGLAFDNAGNLYVANQFSGTIEKFNSSGVGTVFASSGLDAPTGLAFDNAGNLYVADEAKNTIVKFDPAGVGTVFASSGMDDPIGLAFDNAGNLYVANQNTQNIMKFNPAGAGTVFASGLHLPQGLAFDSAGNLYVANQLSDTIEEFNPAGVGTIFASSGLDAPFGLAFRPSLPVAGPTNIVVTSCTNLPVFYSLSVTDICCTNWTVTYTPTSGSLFAPGTTTTVTVLAADSCGNSNSWNFTVTVLPGINCATNCLQVECPTNKTVPCGSAWTFNPPLATTCCTNLTYTLLSSNLTLTTPCETIYAGVWQVTDSCSNSSICTQLVTVVNSGTPVLIPGINLDYATLPDAGISFASGGFTFVGNGSGVQFEVDDVFNGSGDSLGFGGHISSGAPFTIGAITINGSFQTAPVTGSGILHISDGVNQLTGTIHWVDISTVGTSGVLNLNGVVNLTGITYPGTSLDLQSLAASGTAEVDLTFQFIPGQTLTQLAATGGFTDFSGSIAGSPVLTTPPMITCSSNKTVSCGTNWSFDPPVPDGGCCTNWTILVLDTVTNELEAGCATNYTRTWQVLDCCSNLAVCSQTVTVAGCCTNCLNLTCPTNVVVTTCSNCVPVSFFATTTDFCCSNVDISYNLNGQSIGTNYCFPVGTSVIQVTATDGCSNNASCEFTVTVLSCTLTNCINLACPPDIVVMTCSNCRPVYYAASVSDACCNSTNCVHIQFTPPSGSTFCLGSSSVSCTVTDNLGNSASCQFTVTVVPTNSDACQVFHSGMSAGSPLPAGTPDPNFILLSGPPNSGTAAIVTSVLPSPPWPTNSAGSLWLSPVPNSVDSPAGDYHYQLQFYLCCTNSDLYGEIAVDDFAKLYLNGVPVGSLTGFAMTPINVNSGFVTGMNYFDIIVSNGVSYTGMRAELTNCSSCTPPCINLQCPTNVVVATCSNCAPVSFFATATDLCCSNVQISYVFDSTLIGTNYCFPPGTNLVEVMASDECSNTASCGFTVTVLPGTDCATNCLQVQCPSPKTVQCGTAWTFDPPLALTCCPSNLMTMTGILTNVLITPAGSVTNGVCPQVITQTWQITDACGDSATCSQVVTVVNTNPPLLNCASNKTVQCGPDCTGYTVLWNLTTSGTNYAMHPSSGLIEGSDGVLYGVTLTDYPTGSGAVYKVNTDGSGFAVVTDWDSAGNPGFFPAHALVQGNDGALYGNTTEGGINGDSGALFKVNTDGSGLFTLWDWPVLPNDGLLASGALLKGAGGALYGMTSGGGTHSDGTVFTLNEDGTGKTILYNFGATATDAAGPGDDNAGLLLASDGALYGTTAEGGNYGTGAVFKINEDGSGYSVLYSFGATAAQGQTPNITLMEGADGELYGTTQQGGVSSQGTIFKLKKDGIGYTVLHSFSGATGISGINAGGPLYPGRLITGCDGALYGLTRFGGAYANGTLYKINPDGSGYTVLEDFGQNPTDAAVPEDGLLLGSDGAFYGTTYWGGTDGVGTIFRFCACGSEWSFDPPTASDACGGTNVTITVIGTVTNGICPKYITRTWLATDACGNTNFCSQTVTVVGCCPTNCLQIQCWTNIVVASCTNLPVYYQPTATDACCSNYSVMCSPASGSFFAPNTTTTVQVTATDACSNMATCSFTVTVLPGTGCPTNCLQVQSPTNIVMTSCTNITVFYSLSVTDSCCTNWSITFTPHSGSFFASGTVTTVTALATDTCGNTNSQTFTVTVLPDDTCSSTNCLLIQCWTNIVLTSCTNVQVFYDPTLTFVCCTNSVLTVIPPSGSFFAPNTTNIVSCVATDGCGHSTYCPFNVTVLSPPTLAHAPAEIPLCTDSNGCAVMPDATSLVWLSGPTSLWVQGNDATVTQSIPPGTTLCSSTNVLFAAIGSCGPTNISVPVVLLPYGCCCKSTDTTLQFLELPATNVVPVSGTIMTLPGYGLVQVTWTCSANDYIVLYGAGNGAGTTQPQFTYGDPYGNPYSTGGYGWIAGPDLDIFKSSSAPDYTVTFTFLGGPPDISRLFLDVAGLYDTSTATVSQPGYLAGEYQVPIPNCGGCGSGPDISAVTLLDNTTEAPGVPGAAGLTLSSAYDPAGIYQGVGDQRNTGNALFQVTTNVAANTLTLTMNQAVGDGLGLSLAYETNPCPPLVTYYPTNIDVCISNLDGCGLMPNVTGQLQVVANAVVTQSIPPGTTLCTNTSVTFYITNACGLATNLTVPVTLVTCATNECLKLTCPTNIVVTTCSNCAVVHFMATATDTCCSNGVTLAYSPLSGSCFPLGINPVLVTATDGCGNVASCGFTVTVSQDNCRPIISVGPTNFVLCAGTNGCATMPDEVHGSSPVAYALYNTAVAANLLPGSLPIGAASDPHWTLVSVPGLPPASPLEFGTNTELLVSSSPDWAGPDNLSGWIAPANDANNDGPEGDYDYQTTFILPQAGGVSISGQLAADDYVADVLLNGVSTGISITNGAAQLNPFTLAGGGLAGTNTLDFIVHNNPLIGTNPPADNQDTPSGLLVEFTTVTTTTVSLYTPAAVQATNCDGTPAAGWQSIPPGTRLCNDTNITFTFTNACGDTTSYVASVTVETCCTAPPSGMVLWLTLDETVGDTCLNSAGYNNGLRYEGNVLATSANGPTHNLGQYVGNSLCFDGTGDKVVVTNYPAIDFANNNFSMDAWVKWDGGNPTNQVLLDHRYVSRNNLVYGYHWFIANGKPGVQLAAGGNVNGPFNNFIAAKPLAPNVWTHLAVTAQRGSTTGLKFYVNGTLSDTFSLTGVAGSLSNNPVNLWIGASPLAGNVPFNGCLDEIELFDQALLPYEIYDIYAAGHTGKCRPTCSVPSVSAICPGATNLVVSVQICNCGSSTMTFNVGFNGLTAAQAGGNPAVNGPSVFSGYPHTVTLLPDACTNFNVTIHVPAMTSSQVCYYQMTIQDGSGQQFSSIGKITDPFTIYSYNCYMIVNQATNQLFWTAVTNYTFIVNNPTNTVLTLNAMALVLDGNMLPETNLVSLNGLPPGTPATNQLVIAPFGSQPMSVNVNYLDSQPWQPFYLVLFLNLGDGGTFIPVASITFAQVMPPTVGPPLSTSITNGQVVVSWDMVNTGWTLRSTTNLGGTNWIPVNLPVLPLPDGSQGITLPLTNQAQFFQLQGPGSP
jgi:uncharacterized repeat protein (TIGR03803 family)